VSKDLFAIISIFFIETGRIINVKFENVVKVKCFLFHPFGLKLLFYDEEAF
jgi:hypothetical protein